ncbi:MAG: NADP-dependent isocitrate dehydrogenase [Bacteroidia bacterium]|nr:NADP-dependent isocitrate dehydrogenase [Bacteroidia bacterium]MDW8159755.1 NADP-dependent isocitrate dehydrogenase [Bacteroidia bacterium]
MSTKVPITVAKGDGIGPEIMDATLFILQEAGAQLEIEEIEIGEKLYLRGITSGIDDSSWESLLRTKVFLKAPITTPQGGGYKSLNVTTRKTLGLFANVRPCRTYTPYVDSKHSGMDLVIIRENEEDLYAGIEHRQTDEVYQCLKLITRPGTERIIRYAFEYAVANGRKKVTCFSKDNIMKYTDGLFHKIFDKIGEEYPQIEKEHWIIDIGAAKLAATPEEFDVIVTENLYGDIISDIAAQIAGSVGLAGSANIGLNCAMFEAIHGSAPKRAGQNSANPSGLLHGAILMLIHIGQIEVAENIHNAWLRTIEDGIHTNDIYKEGTSKEMVGTKEFAQAVVARLGKKPEKMKPVSYNKNAKPMDMSIYKMPRRPSEPKTLVGVDVFFHWPGTDPNELANQLTQIINDEAVEVTMISNRGTKVWPHGNPETYCTDHWRVRVKSVSSSNGIAPITHAKVLEILNKVTAANLEFIKTENLYYFGNEPGFTLGQGE